MLVTTWLQQLQVFLSHSKYHHLCSHLPFLLRNSLFYINPLYILYILHWADLGHMATLSCKGGWFFPASLTVTWLCTAAKGNRIAMTGLEKFWVFTLDWTYCFFKKNQFFLPQGIVRKSHWVSNQQIQWEKAELVRLKTQSRIRIDYVLRGINSQALSHIPFLGLW